MADTLNGVKNTFSSWDACMSKTYCKWPVIAAIIFGSLIALSLIWCCVRCLCCGVECCCGCLACCNACCPSPRGGGRRSKDGGGYQQAPPTPFGAGGGGGYGGQYAAPMPMNTGYFGAAPGGSGVKSTATFESSSGRLHEDSLPAMPSWDTATSKRVEHHGDDGDDKEQEGVEMDKLQPAYRHQQQQQEVGLLGRDGREYNGRRQEAADLGAGAMIASPYHDYGGGYEQRSPGMGSAYGGQQQSSGYGAQASPYGRQQQQQQTSAYGAAQQRDAYATTQSPHGYTSQAAGYTSPVYQSGASPVATSSPYGGGYSAAPAPAPAAAYGSSADYYQQQQQPQQQQQQQQQQQPYYDSAGYGDAGQRGYGGAAPSYHTQDVGSTSPAGQYQQPQAQQGGYQAFGRKPVQGSWREI
ncbi:uncharacterized protein RCC_12030 [Ramularia collo-cygni]|uniref:Fibroin-3 n=1 Tax=Ramularia collo-cygni TaxID=112498 RepID=A0A2D3UQQ1_9PEZI|nr:uncharacterized protein RCC_12030 [Ramularia collo-cygni]CZT15645.1 uncharacterized protein RCC_12030 [Ramularia collo-cygni]